MPSVPTWLLCFHRCQPYFENENIKRVLLSQLKTEEKKKLIERKRLHGFLHQYHRQNLLPSVPTWFLFFHRYQSYFENENIKRILLLQLKTEKKKKNRKRTAAWIPPPIPPPEPNAIGSDMVSVFPQIPAVF